jgi:O-antigen/teichoic acid export membrane protein
MTNYTKKAAHGSAVVFIGIMLAAFLGYLIRVVLARNLTVKEYGLFYAVYTFVLFFYLFKDLGFGTATIKYISEFNVNKENNLIKSIISYTLTIQLISSGIVVGAFLILSNVLANYYFKDPFAAIILQFLSIMLILNVFDDLLKKCFQGFQEMFYFSIMEFVKNLLTLSLILVFFYYNFGLFSPIYAFVLVGPLMFVIFLPFFLKKFNFFKYKNKYSKSLLKKLTYFAIPSVLTLVGAKFIGYIDVLLLTYFKSLAEVGVYSVVLPTAILCLYLGRSIALVMLPMVSELWTKKEYDKVSLGIRLLQKYVFLIIIPLVFTLIAFSELFLRISFGVEYIQGTLALQILLVGVIFYTLARINNNVISGTGNPKIVTKVITYSALINLGINLILIPKYGINGAALATAVSYIFAFVFSNIKLSKIVKTRLPWLNLSKIFFLGVVMVLMIFYLQKIIHLNVWLELAVILLIATVIYSVLVFSLNLITIKEIKKIIKSASV